MWLRSIYHVVWPASLQVYKITNPRAEFQARFLDSVSSIKTYHGIDDVFPKAIVSSVRAPLPPPWFQQNRLDKVHRRGVCCVSCFYLLVLNNGSDSTQTVRGFLYCWYAAVISPRLLHASAPLHSKPTLAYVCMYDRHIWSHACHRVAGEGSHGTMVNQPPTAGFQERHEWRPIDNYLHFITTTAAEVGYVTPTLLLQTVGYCEYIYLVQYNILYSSSTSRSHDVLSAVAAIDQAYVWIDMNVREKTADRPSACGSNGLFIKRRLGGSPSQQER